MPILRPADPQTVPNAQRALASLQSALHYAKLANSPRTAARIRAAIKSADGAIRHARRRTPLAVEGV